MYPIACFGAVGILAALTALGSMLAPTRKFPLGIGLATMIIGLMALGMGLVGTFLGRHATDEALTMVEAEYADEMRTQGYEEADNNLVLGGLVCVVPLLTGMLAVTRGVLMKDPEKR